MVLLILTLCWLPGERLLPIGLLVLSRAFIFDKIIAYGVEVTAKVLDHCYSYVVKGRGQICLKSVLHAVFRLGQSTSCSKDIKKRKEEPLNLWHGGWGWDGGENMLACFPCLF